MEDQRGRPFQGKSGIELTRYLQQIKLDRTQCYITNLVKERPFTRGASGNVQPTIQDIKRDEPELIDEIRQCKPRFIMAIGAVAAKWLLRDKYDSMEAQWGLPYPLHEKRVEQCGLKRVPWVVPVLHPAAGLHSADAQPDIWRSFRRFGQLYRGELPLVTPVDQYPNPDYREITTSKVTLLPDLPVYIDTEGLLPDSVWGLSYTQAAGRARVIKASNPRALESFCRQLKGRRLVMHHALHDIPIVAALLGMTVEEFLRYVGVIDDTMVKAYCLGGVPQALKPAGRRFHGMKMEGYLDVVRDADREIAIDFLRHVIRDFKCQRCKGDGQYVDYTRVSEKTGKQLAPMAVTCPDCKGDGTSLPAPDERLVREKGRVRISTGWRIGQTARRILKDLRVKGGDVDPRKRWDGVDYVYRAKVEDVTGPMREVSLNDVKPPERATVYSARDADTTYRYSQTLDDLMSAEGPQIQKIYEIDRGTLPLLAVMMDRGTWVDVEYLNKLDGRLERECDKILYKLERETGRYINPNSSKQVAELLFDELKLPVLRYTDGGDPSTQDKVLEDLRLQVAALPVTKENGRRLRLFTYVTDYRERHKLRGTYTLALPRAADKNGRVHTTFNSTRTTTNRLSSSEPNLQNIPARTELGKLVRGAFAAPDGWELVSVDYSQIEVVVVAHVSQDKHLIDALCRGLDIHTVTAARIFKKKVHEKGCECGKCPTVKQRYIAKRITFLILYGGGAERLRAELKLDGIEVSVVEAQGYINAYLHEAYPGLGDYLLESASHARRYGYVEDMHGWRRYLPGVHSAIRSVRMEAERMAGNAEIQGGAAGIMRRACPVILEEAIPYVRKKGYDCYPLLTVHDEIVAEVEVGGGQLLSDALVRAMVGVMKLDAPIKASGAWGKRWSELK